MRPPAPMAAADVLVTESTYGDRHHVAENPERLLGDVVRRVTGRGGVVLIPAPLTISRSFQTTVAMPAASTARAGSRWKWSAVMGWSVALLGRGDWCRVRSAHDVPALSDDD